MSFNVNDIISKIGGNDLVKGLADKAGLGALYVGQGAQPQGVARRHHQPLRALRKSDDLVQTRLE